MHWMANRIFNVCKNQLLILKIVGPVAAAVLPSLGTIIQRKPMPSALLT